MNRFGKNAKTFLIKAKLAITKAFPNKNKILKPDLEAPVRLSGRQVNHRSTV